MQNSHKISGSGCSANVDGVRLASCDMHGYVRFRCDCAEVIKTCWQTGTVAWLAVRLGCARISSCKVANSMLANWTMAAR